MANILPSANMSLPIPVVGVDPGPDSALNLNACLSAIDAHNHTPGSGVPIPSAGININADLVFNLQNATQLRSVRLSSNSAVLASASDLLCLSAVANDLYWNDGAGNKVRLTQSGAVAGTPGSFSNLVAPASASYVVANQSFVFQSSASTPGNLDAGFLNLRNSVANSKSLTLQPPASMAANYALTLPVLPTASLPVSLDTSGNFYTAQISTAQIADSNVTTSKLADQGITTAKLLDGGVTGVKIAQRPTGASVGAGGFAISATSGGFSTTSATLVNVTNLSVTITTVGRPVILMLIPDGASPAYIGVISPSTFGNAAYSIGILRGATNVYTTTVLAYATSAGGACIDAPGSISTVDVVAAGTYTYQVQASAPNNTGSTNVNSCKLVAYEIC